MDFVDRVSGASWSTVNPSTLFKFTDLDYGVQRHLQKVYATLACAVALTVLGVYADLTYHIGGVFTFIGAFACLIGLCLPSPRSTDYNKRYAMLAGFSFCHGCSIAPLVDLAVAVNPGLLLTALAATCAVFMCFTVSALLTNRRAYLFLGGWLSSAVMGLMIIRLSGAVLGTSATMFQFEVLAGILIFSGYILFDTQLIVEKAAAGETDHVRHALDLLVDLLALFVRILVLLLNDSKKEEKKDKKRK